VSYRIQRCTYLIPAILIAGFITESAAQRRPAGQAQEKQGIQVSLKVGAQTYQSNEPGRCTHAPKASIYRIVSALWSVQQSPEGRSLSLSFWRPADASGDMLSLSIRNGNTSHEVSTVRGGGAPAGSGKITFEKAGAGGTFTIDAKSKDGAPISGTIKCDAFAPHGAEGGL
jgi:hypothetical protein